MGLHIANQAAPLHNGSPVLLTSLARWPAASEAGCSPSKP